MDLIEDVSRASQNLKHELLNTNTGFLPPGDDDDEDDEDDDLNRSESE